MKLHGLRMLRKEIVTNVPLSSADSTNVARNIGMDGAWSGAYAPATKECRTDVLVNRIESHQSPRVMSQRWAVPEELTIFDMEEANA